MNTVQTTNIIQKYKKYTSHLLGELFLVGAVLRRSIVLPHGEDLQLHQPEEVAADAGEDGLQRGTEGSRKAHVPSSAPPLGELLSMGLW